MENIKQILEKEYIGNSNAITWKDECSFCLWYGKEVTETYCKEIFGVENPELNYLCDDFFIIGDILFANNLKSMFYNMQNIILEKATYLISHNLIYGEVGRTTDKYIKLDNIPYINVKEIYLYEEDRYDFSLDAIFQYNADLSLYYKELK